ncbi:unnamed protein product [Amoebophrya sp. A120]|nr:unnamed protein product [Amoebophrya sp. A120]|eukprot:GSA120T00013950001.1
MKKQTIPPAAPHELRVAGTTSTETNERNEPNKKRLPGVAYLLLTGDGEAFDQAALWRQYFRTCDPTRATANLYVHTYKKTFDPETLTVSGAVDEKAKAWKNLFDTEPGLGSVHFVPRIHTAWGELVPVMWWLVVNALQEDHGGGKNEQFVFLSEGHVPLKNCTFVHEELLEQREKKAAFGLKKQKQEQELQAQSGSALQQASKSGFLEADQHGPGRGGETLAKNSSSASATGTGTGPARNDDVDLKEVDEEPQVEEVSRTSSKVCMVPEQAVETMDPGTESGCIFVQSLESQVPRHHQWGTLSRPDAELFKKYILLGLNLYFANLVHQKVGTTTYDAANIGASDEFIFGSTLLIANMIQQRKTFESFYNVSETNAKAGVVQVSSRKRFLLENGVKSDCTTFLHWRRCLAGTGLEQPYVSEVVLVGGGAARKAKNRGRSGTE